MAPPIWKNKTQIIITYIISYYYSLLYKQGSTWTEFGVRGTAFDVRSSRRDDIVNVRILMWTAFDCSPQWFLRVLFVFLFRCCSLSYVFVSFDHWFLWPSDWTVLIGSSFGMFVCFFRMPHLCLHFVRYSGSWTHSLLGVCFHVCFQIEGFINVLEIPNLFINPFFIVIGRSVRAKLSEQCFVGMILSHFAFVLFEKQLCVLFRS